MSKSLKTWSKFSAKKKDGSVVNLKIVEMPEYLQEKVIYLYIDHFVKEESTYKVSGLSKSRKALEELYGFLTAAPSEDGFHVVICCLDNDDEKIKKVFGASIMSLTSKGDSELQFDVKTKEMKKLLEIVHGMDGLYNEMKAFDLDRCFSDRGIFVCPKYRGLGIAQEFLKARRLICKEYGIPINGAWMTSLGSQKAAERDGWETMYEIQNEELGKLFGVTYGEGAPSSKFMIARIEV